MATREQIAKLYVATFNRAADADGLTYWISDGTDATTSLTDLTALSAAMTDSAEYQALYSGLDREALVTAMYNNLFDRAPAADGLAYWVSGDGSTVLANEMVVALINGAQGDDVTIMDNKATVGLDFADKGLNDTTLAKTVMSGVTADTATVTAAEAIITDHLPQTFTLTTGADTLTGGAGDDTFNADLLTVNNGDTLDGKAGNDTLNMTVNANVSNQVTISNIEDINYTTYGATTVDMTKITGVKNFTVTDSTGTVTLNNQADATTAYGFKGASTNDITVNYKAGTLSGTSDKAVVNADTASNINFDVDAGYESLEINATGANSIAASGLTVPGVTSLTIKGSGSLNVNNNLSGFSTIDSTGLTGALTSGAANAAGFASNTITGSSNGTAMLLGAGDDNVGFTSAAIAGKSDTIKLGAGNDTFEIDVTTAGDDYVFGEAGDDTIQVAAASTKLKATDVIDGGAGTDTLILTNAAANNDMLLRGIENLTLNGATGTNTINSADSALTVTAKINAANDNVDIEGLTAGSTVKVESKSGTTNAAGAVTVKFANAEATSTVDIASGMTGALTLDKITDATVNLGAASAMTTNDVSTTAVTNLTINAAKAFTQTTGDIVTTDNKMAKVTIDGQDAVSIGDVTSTGLTDVKVTAVKDLSIGTTSTATQNKLATVDLTSTSGKVDAGAIGVSTNAELTSVNLKAAKAIGSGAAIAIDSVKIGTVTAESTGDAVILGTIGANATNLGDVTVTAAKALTVGMIGDSTSGNSTVASDITATATNGALTVAGINTKTLGTVNLTSTAGAIDGPVGPATNLVDATDTTGITVNMSAKTYIDDGGLGHAATNEVIVINNDGDVTASLGGAAAAVVDYTAATSTVTSAVVNLTATNTGGLISNITNAGAATLDDSSTSTITLGNATSTSNGNVVVFEGSVQTLNVTGGTGDDTVYLGTTGLVTKGGTISADTVAFTNVDSITTGKGVAINLSSSTHTFSDTNSTTVAALHAVQYDSADAANNVVSNGYDFTLNGVSSVTGSSFNDYIIANAAGTTITGGAGADKITLGAGADVLDYTTVTDSSSASAAGNDTVSNFVSGQDKFDVTTIPTIVAKASGSVDAASFNTNIDTILTTAAANAVQLIIANAGDLNGQSYLVQDVDGDGTFDAGTDLLINVTGITLDATANDLIVADFQ